MSFLHDLCKNNSLKTWSEIFARIVEAHSTGIAWFAQCFIKKTDEKLMAHLTVECFSISNHAKSDQKSGSGKGTPRHQLWKNPSPFPTHSKCHIQPSKFKDWHRARPHENVATLKTRPQSHIECVFDTRLESARALVIPIYENQFFNSFCHSLLEYLYRTTMKRQRKTHP